jgi:hypothetical protein
MIRITQNGDPCRLALWLIDHTDSAATGCNSGFSATEGISIHVEIGAATAEAKMAASRDNKTVGES